MPAIKRGYIWAVSGVLAATGLFWLFRSVLDKGQASMLYFPVVIVCAIRFGFGPAVAGAVVSFLCWNYFFLPPVGTWVVHDPKDWLSLVMFLLVAVATARLAAQASERLKFAQAREAETEALRKAGEQVSSEVDVSRVLPLLARRLSESVGAARCIVFQASEDTGELTVAGNERNDLDEAGGDGGVTAENMTLARMAYEAQRPIGIDRDDALWNKALRSSESEPPAGEYRLGAYFPLVADGHRHGVLHIGPRMDGLPFSAYDLRIIAAMANHAAVALARERMSREAAQSEAHRESDELKTLLLSMVSHELRSPLTAIKASAGSLLAGQAVLVSEDTREAAESIDHECDRLTGLVAKLLDLSRLQAGVWQPEPDWCDLVDVAGAALARLTASEQDLVQIDAPPDLPLARVDAVQIGQVITNLLENALKYSPPASPIAIRLYAELPDLHIEVIDRGPGLSPHEANFIFDRFYRSAQARAIPGTGLGLAICRSIVEAHGGTIGQHNRPEGGSVFSVTLPLPKQDTEIG